MTSTPGSNATGTISAIAAVVNQVQFAYDGWGQEAIEYQATTSAVNTSTTPSVQYVYSEDAGGQNNDRLTGMIYPNGRATDYLYGSAEYPLSSLTHSGTTATATMGSNVYTVGQSVTVSGASPSAYDGTFTVTAVNTTSHTFTYTMTSTPGSNASGSDMVATTPSDTLDGTISRVSALMDHAGTSAGVHLEEYAYLGLDTTVILNRPEDNTELTYVQVPGDTHYNTDGGDSYTGLDRFGRVIDQYWLNTASSPNAVDRLQYGYDRDGNVLYTNNLGPNGSSGAPSTQAAAFSQLYHANSSASGDDNTAYDPLGRLTNMRRGALSASANNGGVLDTVTTLNSTTGITDDSASWSLNAVGGWSSVTTDGTASSHTDNAQNEITAVGATGLTYDNNGNLTKNDQGYTLTYDAWNRLMTSSNQSLKIQYDALGRYDHENYASGINELYYDTNGHQIEVYDNGVYTQYVWGLAYVNELILRDKDADGTSSGNYGISGSHLEQRLYAEFDANYNTTSLYQVNGTPGIAERIIYDPYGKTQLLTASWASFSSSTLFFRILYQGEYQLSEANVYIMGARMYDYTLGAWDQKDPIGYPDGMNDYEMERSNPVVNVDPFGDDAEAPTSRPGTQPATQPSTQPTDPIQDIFTGLSADNFRTRQTAGRNLIGQVKNLAGKGTPGQQKARDLIAQLRTKNGGTDSSPECARAIDLAEQALQEQVDDIKKMQEQAKRAEMGLEPPAVFGPPTDGKRPHPLAPFGKPGTAPLPPYNPEEVEKDLENILDGLLDKAFNKPSGASTQPSTNPAAGR